MKALFNIQQELKAPKGQTNSFGNYKYRSLEDILEAVKPLLKKYECTLKISDELISIGERYYVKATAELCDTKDNTSVINTAYARETETKKGMDDSQITGATSSYARKYALNGLFAIDDTKDADTDEVTAKTRETQNGKKKPVATELELKTFRDFAETLGEDYKKVWLSTGKAYDMSKEHLAKAQEYLLGVQKSVKQ